MPSTRTCSPPAGCSTSPVTPTPPSSSWPPRPGCSIRSSRRTPARRFIPANRKAACKFMKMITLPKLRDALRDERPVVKVDPALAESARMPIERMVAIGPDGRRVSPTLRRLAPDSAVTDTDCGHKRAAAGRQAPAHRPYMAMNFVATLDGRATVEGRSGPIGDQADRELFHGLRTQADAVMVGANTAHGGALRPAGEVARPRRPPRAGRTRPGAAGRGGQRLH